VRASLDTNNRSIKMTDYFVPKRSARQEGCPYHPDYAIRLAKQGLYPAPIRLSARRVGWMKSALQGWLENRAAA
jgi:hypothetical protein